ncbi:hypothetical protein NDI45_12790 [Leptolyngbya sp. GB1-A1]|uniref:hypothetical protein n=1 Tax=Leptolyngbya sp. GB1-A1 TaxID=2933908 RepID=UPI003299DEF7
MIAQIQEARNDAARLEEHLDAEEAKYQQGLQDGMRSMLRRSLFESVSYMAGYNEGMTRRVRFGVKTEEQWLERGWGDELLNDEF